MKTRFDLKSAVLGLVAGVLLVFSLGAGATPGGPVGRFQMATTEAHALLVDTKTGQVWRGFFPAGSGNTDGDLLRPKVKE